MRSTSRAALLVAAVVALLALAPSSFADEFVDRQGWVETGPLGPLAPQDGHLYVSAVAGAEQARTYVAFADPSTTGVLTLEEAADGVRADAATLAACALVAPYRGEESAPDPDCGRRASLTRDDGRWTVPLDAFAGVLANGIAIVADGEGPFTVAFDAASTACACSVAADGDGDGDPAVAVTPDDSQPPLAAAAPAFEPVTGTPLRLDSVPGPPPAQAAEPRPAVPSRTDEPVNGVPVRLRPAFVASPPAAIILVPLAVNGLVLWWLRRRPLPGPLPPIALTGPRLGWAGAGALLALLLVTSSESTAFRLGFIAIVFVGSIGLHVLVNWAGELSLGHAAFVGLPAFAVAQAASHAGMSPILFVPLGVVVGVLLGVVVATAALRARGLQVALVTLALGIAVIQFLFVRSWVIGTPSGLNVGAPSLFGWELESSRSLVPVLAVLVAVACVSARWIFASKLGRAFAFIRAEPSAAAAAGIPVNQYRALAYAIAGGYAGLAGAAYVIWVQRVRPEAFPLTLGFTYLVIAVLAGRGGLAGLAVSAVLIQGGALFSIIPQSVSLYLGPVALIYNATRYQQGFNGGIAALSHLVRSSDLLRRKVPRMQRRTLRVPVVVAILTIVAGFSALGLAWYHTGNTDQLWIQNQEIVSGGLGGIALVIVGAALLVRDALLHGRGGGDG